MAEKENPRSTAGRGLQSSDDGERTWARVVQGPSRGPLWTSHKISSTEIDQLQAYFSRVLELPESIMEESCRQWEGLAIVVRSLGRRVPADWISKEIKSKAKLNYEPEVFPIAEDHLVVWLKSEQECSLVRSRGAWFVGGQLLAMEEWVSDFVPG